MSTDWLSEEVAQVNAEMRRANHSKRHQIILARHENTLMLRLIVCLAVFFCAIGCMLEAKPLLLQQALSWFPNTWTCKSCGFDNYEGLDSCGICGHSRYGG